MPSSPRSSQSRRGTRPRQPLNIDTSLASSPPPPHLAPLAPPDDGQPQALSHPDPDSPRARTRQRQHQHHPADESFYLDHPTPVDMNDHRSSSSTALPRPRDSHDLSLTARDVTRDSLVTNMLLSLDQFSLGQPTSNARQYDNETIYDDAPQTYESTRTWANNLGNGHHQYSYSSDLDAPDDQSRMSSQNSRGRRSNSSSNVPTSFARYGNVRDGMHSGQSGTSRGIHSRGGRGSNKSSSSASIDAGYVQGHGGHRLARGGGFTRSQSFDHGPPQQPPPPMQHQQFQQQLQQSGPMSPFRVDFSSSYADVDDDDDFNAAPTPTVPGGPRRIPSTPIIPRPPPEPVEQHAVERKRSISRSLKSSSGRKGSSHRQAPPPAMPALDLDSAPAPNIGYERTKELQAGRPTSGPAPAQPKEKQPGFFRRVFGGGSKNNPPSNGPIDSPKSSQFTTSTDISERPGSNKMGSQANQSAHGSAPPSRDTTSSHSHHPTLQKKPSSFFRRRKKSVVDEQPPLPMSDAPPVPPIAPVSYQTGTDKPEPSPVSSLRKVMNPYLRTNGASPSTPTQGASPLADVTNTSPDPESHGRQEYKREFSPDYEPSPNARIRTVRSHSDQEVPRTVADTPTRPPPQRPGMPAERNNSFLEDGSDNEHDLPIQANSKSPGKGNKTSTSSSRMAPKKDEGRDDTLRAKKKAPFSLETDSEDDPTRSNLALPIEGARAASPASTGTGYKSALSEPPSVRIEESAEPSPKVLGTLKSMKSKSFDEPEFVVGEPTEDDRSKAQKIYDGNEDFIQREKAAAWMGEEGTVRQRTLQAYIELYDFSEQSVVSALRQICGRLVLRAETQQVDRILVAFSKRWCTCNPNHGFKSTDIIHTICYSIMLLNTDLHLADIEQKMTRSQFVKNTMTTITQAVAESVPGAFERQSVLPEKNNMLGAEPSRTSLDQDRKSFRNSFKPPSRQDGQNGAADYSEECGPLVKTPFNGTAKAWEEQVELVLKGIYTSIRDERLPLFGAEPERHMPTTASQGSLSVMGMLKRSPSVLSKAPSESQMSTRGRIADSAKSGASRWASKSRSRPGMGRNGFSSSRTSLDDGNSIWSPALSSATWSRYSLGRTQTSVSQDSFGSAMPRGDYQQSIGFANALSQAIIRDEDANGEETAPSIMNADIPATQLLDDESLELAGPPWVKEGMVIHKHHLDGVDKKAKDRNWAEVFAVIQKGQMSMFSFNAKQSARQKNRGRSTTKVNTPVGGGNWQDNAVNMGTFSLRQTLASALPPPGYSRTRPHVWALSLPTGAVHLFQVGTPEIIKEFVNTVNYWSARLSTHPLVGGISNIEYGWSDAIVNNALVAAINETTPQADKRNSRPGSAATGRRSSVQSGSFRSASLDQGSGSFTHGRGKLPGDRIHIAKWTPPTQSLRPSNSGEAEQLETLQAYVKGIEDELQAHNQLRSPMLLAFTPRASNAAKAMANWETKSAYLLREIVKFRTYVDCLQQAETRKREIYTERDLARRAARGELSDGDMEVSGSEEGDVTLKP